VASWGENFYDEPVVRYQWLGQDTLFVMDPPLIQEILLDDINSYSREPLNDDVFGAAVGAICSKPRVRIGGGCGANRSNSTRRDSRPRPRPRAIAAPICRLAPAHGSASARVSPCSRERPFLATLLAEARFALPNGSQPTPFARITLGPKEGLKLSVTMLD
jgi:hypothetical protein